ncbi:activity-regulated cytoskeleton associated protein 1-like [Drosophila grimshawi]|uniref:activity-regulated cytoskeleton associated protein 1-like n=1 Tax=Drosophila grimshawi TaxID=7222 RepID=UPI000C86F82D|nr:activity-regulated cytoskeleton associated protein 1-like [Drosophila grimshawi]
MPHKIQMTSDQLRDLIEGIRTAVISAAGYEVVDGSDSTMQGSFINCFHRFGGARDHLEVEEFIKNIVTYKEVENISDEKALKGISLLFFAIASTWWKGVRKEAKTWEDAIRLIRDHFSPTKPAYQIYIEFFQKKQAVDDVIDEFVLEKRALLAQLPEDRHDEETELDFLYGLLNIKYRKHISRQSVHTFNDLLEQGRIFEHNNQENKPNPQSHRSGSRGGCRGGSRGGSRGRGTGIGRSRGTRLPLNLCAFTCR